MFTIVLLALLVLVPMLTLALDVMTSDRAEARAYKAFHLAMTPPAPKLAPVVTSWYPKVLIEHVLAA